MNKMYSFEKNVKRNKENRNHEQWDQAYCFFFPEMSHMKEIPDEDERQRVGIDYIVYLKDGTQYNIDEKVDWKGYPRFPIEIWQAYNLRYPGWAVKEGQQTEYIAYLVEPKQDHYLIPYQELKDVYHRNEEQWLSLAKSTQRNGFVYADSVWNNTEDGVPWNTHSVCVPFDVLRSHMPSIQLWNPNNTNR